MKRILLALLLPVSCMFFAQSVSCNDLVNYAKAKDPYPDVVRTYGSSMLVKAEYYEVEDTGLVIAYIRKNEYDFTGKPYIFCGISSRRWSTFKIEGITGSYGKAFHAYIMDYTCNCD